MMTRMLASYNYFGITARQIFPEYDETMKWFDAPINQDILLYRSTSDENFSTNTFMSVVYQPMVNYISPYRFVATSLGNECANQLMPAGSKFIDMGVEVYVKLKGKVLWGLVGITLLKVNYETLIYARAVPTASDGNRKIASVKCVFALKLFGAYNIAKTGYDKSTSVSTSIIPYDGVPGSNQQILGFNSLREYYNALAFLSGVSTVLNTNSAVSQYIQAIDKAIKAIKKAKTFLDVLQSPGFFGLSLQPGFTAATQSFYTEYTYLPVGSALDVDPFNSNTFTQKYVNGVNQNYPSKSNTFIAQETVTGQSLFNNASMRFTARNARFMFKEMQQLPNTENCSAECSTTFVMAGSDQICTAETFNLPGLPGGVSVAWNVTPTGIVTPSGTGNLITLTRNPNANGLITLSATFSICGISQTYTKTIHVGIPNLSQLSIGGVTDNQFVCPNVPIPMGIFYLNSLYSCGIVAGSITNAQWSVETPSSSATINYNAGMAACEATNNNAGVTITFPNLGYTYTANVRVRAFNSCGWSNWFPAPMLRLQVNPNYTNCSGGGFENRIVVSPNPSTGVVTIEASQNFSFTQIRVFDKFGAVRKQFNFPKGSKKVTINIGELPTDTYEIQAFDGKEWSIKSIIKQ